LTGSRAAIDHFVLAAPDLDRACAQFEASTGVRPVFGGSHPGGGTRNALVAFDAASYLEIIAPDPAQPPTAMSGPMARLTEPTLLHWAARVSGLESLSARLRELGWTTTDVRRMNRTPPDGVRLDWELFGVRDHRYGGLVPFFIDWLGSPHPATTSPRVGAIARVRLTAPEPAPLQALIGELGLSVTVAAGEPALALAFASPRGEIGFRTVSPAGFTLG
jgi:catechol 2,3-dioxygenase-like lactoylglutathione lyase family enzyme